MSDIFPEDTFATTVAALKHETFGRSASDETRGCFGFRSGMNAYGIILNDIGLEPLIDELQ